MTYTKHILLVLTSKQYRLFRIYAILAEQYDSVTYKYTDVLTRWSKLC